jgi:glutamate synthase (NADPH/NADH) small chain
MEKQHIERRVRQMEAEGVTFHYGANIGVTLPFAELTGRHDAVLLAGGAEAPRDPALPGTELDGVYFAMPYLVQQNRRIGGEDISGEEPILSTGKHVVVIGGGDTASDCIGTSFRQGAISVTQLDIRPRPPQKEDKLAVWPYWPTKMRTSSSQAEGAEREFQVATLSIEGKKGRVIGVKVAEVDEKRVPIAGTERVLRADTVYIAIGFAGALKAGLVEQAGVAMTRRGSVEADETSYRTSQDKVYCAGDMRRGQSLVVWAIREGRQCAAAVDRWLSAEAAAA